MSAQPRHRLAPPSRVARRYRPDTPLIRTVEIHDHDCDCAACQPYAPSIEPRLDATAIGKLAVAACLLGNAIAFAYDPAAAWAALRATVGL